MTAAVRAQLLAAGAKIPNEAASVPQVQRTPAPKGKAQTATPASIVEPETPKGEIPALPSVASTHYIGRYQLNVANGTHYPGRARYVVTGPASEALTAALVAALTQFVKP